jgi:DNA-binding MarR family transcriptional regulator
MRPIAIIDWMEKSHRVKLRSMPQRTMELAEQILAINRQSWVDDTGSGTDLTQSEYLALEYLSKHGTATVGAIRRGIGVLPAQMSRIVRSLEEAGCITCEINPDDKRRINVTMTDNGRDAFQGFREAKLRTILAALNRLTDEEKAQFMMLLNKMAGTAQTD